MKRVLLWIPWVVVIGAIVWWVLASDPQREDLLRALRREPAGETAPSFGSLAERTDDEAAGGEAAAGDDDEEVVPSRVERAGGLSAVRLSVESQQQTGIRLLELVETTRLSETLASGRVLDVGPLVQLRADYHAARGEKAVADAAVAASSRSAQRLRLLNRDDGNVSTRQLQEAEAQAAADSARATAAARRLDDLRNQALAAWGTTLVEMALSERSPAFDALVARQDVLVLVTLRPGEELPVDASFIYVGPTGERLRARKAYLVAPAVQTDLQAPGETYLFRTNAAKLRLGMRMDAWIPRPGEPSKGVEVPGAAVIWYANKLWVYVQRGEDLFVRQPLNVYEETRDGWFVTEGLKPGEAVVVSGAQMLFSEEFRSAIPSEDEARE